MPLGDSITAGDLHPEGHHGYRGYLYGLLTARGLEVDFVGTQHQPPKGGGDPDHEGRDRHTIGPDDSRLCRGCGPANLSHFVDEFMQEEPDVILLMIGVNDLFPGPQRRVEPAAAGDKLEALTRRLVSARPSVSVLLATTLPLASRPEGWPEQFALNRRVAEIAAADPRIHYVDAFTETGLSAGDWHDDVHLSRSGAQKLAHVWYQHLVAVLGHESPGGPASQ
jgi:lysophospholipase L1-like esterase